MNLNGKVDQFKNMLYKIPYSFAVKFQLGLLIFVFAFHFLVLGGWIPFTIVWGGKLKTHDEMLAFESVSIAVNALLFAAIIMHQRMLPAKLLFKIARLFLFLFSGLFVLNTLGNLLAEMQLEAIIFTPITFLSAIFCLRIALEKKKV